jgi:hypothetical protein
MKLEGSCQCGKVRFAVESETPFPYMFCYCSICRKLTGGPFGCNIMGRRDTLRVTGRRHLKTYHARVREAGKRTRLSSGSRLFCGACGTHLWVQDDDWPDGVWPNAGAIDTPLPVPPEHVFMMTRFRPAWAPLEQLGPGLRAPRYPRLSIADWHRSQDLFGARRAQRPDKKGKA